MKSKMALLAVACAMTLLTACASKDSQSNQIPSIVPSPQATVDALPEGTENPEASSSEALSEDDGDVLDGDLQFNIEVSGGSVDADPQDIAGYLGSVSFGEKERVLEYIEAGVNIDAIDELGFGALTSALMGNDTEMAQLLLEHGAGINIQNDDNNTPLVALADYRSVDMVRFLLENGADPNIGGGANHDYYPIIIAALFNIPEIVELLLAHGAYPNLEYVYDDETVNAIQIAERYGFTEIVEMIQNSL